MLGTLANTGAVLLGSLIGLLVRLLGKSLARRQRPADLAEPSTAATAAQSPAFPSDQSQSAMTQSGRFQAIVMSGIGLFVLYLGISGALAGQNALIAIISLVVGGLIGELCRLDDGLHMLGEKIESRFAPKNGASGSVTEGFVTASLLFCVGAMAILGPLQSGTQGDHTILFTKSLIDGITAIVLASSLGFGVLFSAVPVFLLQGGITLLAGWIAPLLGETVIAEMNCVGYILIIGIALNLLGLTKLKLVNLLPAIFLPILLCRLFPG